MKVYAICGAGVGTSTLLKMNIEDVYKKLNLNFTYRIYNTSVSLAKSANADLIYSFQSFEKDVQDMSAHVIIINNLMDLEEIENKTIEYLKSINKI